MKKIHNIFSIRKTLYFVLLIVKHLVCPPPVATAGDIRRFRSLTQIQLFLCVTWFFFGVTLSRVTRLAQTLITQVRWEPMGNSVIFYVFSKNSRFLFKKDNMMS